MNEPFNIDEDGMFYDVPPTPPHTLTDARAGYDAPSEAALAFAEKVQKACLLDVNLYDLLQHDVARLLDAFAAQAVAAREAEIVAELERGKASLLEMAHQSRRRPRDAATPDSQASILDLVIAIVTRK